MTRWWKENVICAYPVRVPASELSTGEAAVRLGVSRPTVRKLIRDGQLTGYVEERGSRGRFAWRISATSIEAYLKACEVQGIGVKPGKGKRITVSQLSDHLDALRGELRALAGAATAPTGVADLRIEVATLRESLVQQRAIAAASSAADQARAEVVQHLLAALTASEDADRWRREAIAAAETMVGQFVTPGDARGING
jgi:excisionase family DNA binding protein